MYTYTNVCMCVYGFIQAIRVYLNRGSYAVCVRPPVQFACDRDRNTDIASCAGCGCQFGAQNYELGIGMDTPQAGQAGYTDPNNWIIISCSL